MTSGLTATVQSHPARGADCQIGNAAGEWLLCRTGRLLHALPIELVIEIMRVLPIEPIVGLPPYVAGLSIIRGKPIPVVDVGLLVGGQATPSTRLVMVKAGKRTVALRFEAVLGIRRLDARDFGQLPPMLNNVESETVEAIGAIDAELLFALRAARAVPDSVFDELDRAVSAA